MKPITIRTGATALALAAAVCCGMKTDLVQDRLGRSLHLLTAVLEDVSTYYVDGADTEELAETGIHAMLGSLDPYTEYFPASETGDLLLMTQGRYAGIGALIGKHGRDIVIREPYLDSPAGQAGLLPGDILLSVDGKGTAGMEPDAVSDLLKGKEGEGTVLHVARKYCSDTLEFHTTRRQVQLPCIPFRGMAGATTGYVCLRSFTDQAAEGVRQAVLELRQKGAASLILDLRENGGGLMEEAVDILSLFLPRNTAVVDTRGRSPQSRRTHVTRKEPLFPDMPLAVLVDRNSASASEIVAGALQDLDRAVIIGEKSFGKGLVQHIRKLPYNARIKLTTARYHIPSGRCIQALDYTRRNADGTARRTEEVHRFRTLHGREVLDGGGIQPDVAVAGPGKKVLELVKQDIIFDFVNDYALRHEEGAGPAGFSLEESLFQKFILYLEERNFNCRTRSHELLEKLTAATAEEGCSIRTERLLAELRKELDRKEAALSGPDRKDMEYALSIHLMRRYHHLQGEVEYRMHHDREVRTAVDLLQDPARLGELLGKTQE